MVGDSEFEFSASNRVLGRPLIKPHNPHQTGPDFRPNDATRLPIDRIQLRFGLCSYGSSIQRPIVVSFQAFI